MLGTLVAGLVQSPPRRVPNVTCRVRVKVSLVDHEMVPILPLKQQRPIAVAYDDVNQLVYWTDVGRRTINSYRLFDNNSTINTVYLDRDGLTLAYLFIYLRYTG